MCIYFIYEIFRLYGSLFIKVYFKQWVIIKSSSFVLRPEQRVNLLTTKKTKVKFVIGCYLNLI